MTRQRHTCPYRRLAAKPARTAQYQDAWVRRDTGGTGEVTCSWCGSLQPARFMELAGQGWIVLPGDTDDQAGIGEPATSAQAARSKAGWLAARGVPAACGRRAAAIARAAEREWEEHGAPLAPGARQGEVRFLHLSAAHRAAFARLHDTGKLAIGFPGAFYVTPWFMTAGDWDEQ